MTLKKKSSQQITNLKLLEQMWVNLPIEQVSQGLRAFRELPNLYRKSAQECGTIACIGGHAATMPEFQAQGLSLGPGGLSLCLHGNEHHGEFERIAFVLTGDANLFSLVNWHPADKPLLLEYKEWLLGDGISREQTHAVALNRIRYALTRPHVSPLS